MKIIDLLNKIANGEEVPKYVKYKDRIDNREKIVLVCKENIIYKLDQLEIELNDEVEILEEEKKIPEKLEPLQKDYMTLDDIKFTFSNSEMILVDKINSIIDYLKSKGDKYE